MMKFFQSELKKMTRLAVFLLSLSLLFGCTSAELNSWGIPAVASKDSEKLKDLEVFQDSGDDIAATGRRHV